MSEKPDIMLDIETFGHHADAVILQIGYAAFTAHAPFAVLEHGTLYVDVQSCLDAGLRVDGSTLLWWMGSDRDAGRAALVQPPTEPIGLKAALVLLSEQITRLNPARVWAMPPQFDLTILKTAYLAVGINQVPWHFRSERCLRTLYDMVDFNRKKAPKPRIAHQAGEDARAQALGCQMALGNLCTYTGAI